MLEQPESKHRRVVLLLCNRMLATSVSLPIEMLQTAQGAALGQHLPMELELITASSDSKPVTSSCGFQIQPDQSFIDIESADLLLIPGLWRNPRVIIQQQPAIIDFIRQQYQQGALISAVGTGSCFMAEAGLLDNKAATTHWYYLDQFQRAYPQVLLKRQYFITQADNLYCAASINALADLMVHFIRRWYNDAIANLVQRHFSHEIRKDFASSSFFTEGQAYIADEVIVQAQAWLTDHYQESFKLADIAAQFGMSARTFQRRFKAATHKTPLEFLQQLRIQVATDLLQTTNLSIQEITAQVGYQDISHLASLFRAHLNTSPSEYRHTVRAKLFGD